MTSGDCLRIDEFVAPPCKLGAFSLQVHLVDRQVGIAFTEGLNFTDLQGDEMILLLPTHAVDQAV